MALNVGAAIMLGVMLIYDFGDEKRRLRAQVREELARQFDKTYTGHGAVADRSLDCYTAQESTGTTEDGQAEGWTQ